MTTVLNHHNIHQSTGHLFNRQHNQDGPNVGMHNVASTVKLTDSSRWPNGSHPIRSALLQTLPVCNNMHHSLDQSKNGIFNRHTALVLEHCNQQYINQTVGREEASEWSDN